MKIFLKLLHESFVFALHAIRVNRLRTVLSLLGITIGVFCIVFVFTATGSLERKIRDSLSELEQNVLFIQKWPWAFNDPNYPWWEYLKRPEPKYLEVAELKKRSETIDAAAYMTSVSRNVGYAGKTLSGTTVMGVSEDYNRVKDLEMQEGRPLSDQEYDAGRNMAMIGSEVASNLFPDGNAVGRDIIIFHRKLKVAGVFRKDGQDDFGGSLDNVVIIPVAFLARFIDMNSEHVSGTILVKSKPGVTLDEMKDEIRGIMRSVRKLKPYAEDDFAINQTSLLSEGIDSIFRVVSIAGWLIGGFALLVGAFGIANIMYVSVHERINQIGIQKSLGAKRYFILFQFLFESVFLSLFGGLMGMLISMALSTIISASSSFEMSMSLGNWTFGLVLSIVIGLVAGILPAYRASGLDPVEAIRYNG
jgi:putative ABC transport system permease protein